MAGIWASEKIWLVRQDTSEKSGRKVTTATELYLYSLLLFTVAVVNNRSGGGARILISQAPEPAGGSDLAVLRERRAWDAHLDAAHCALIMKDPIVIIFDPSQRDRGGNWVFSP